MGVSSDRNINDNCVCMYIPKIKDINYNTGEITFICEIHKEKKIAIKDFLQ